MPGEVRLNQKELEGLIEQIEAEGGDATELKKLRAEFAETQPQKPARRQLMSVVPREEETTEERLSREAGDFFLGGISADILGICIEYDSKYSLGELRGMCVEAGLSLRGHKKLLAAKLIAHQWRQKKEKEAAGTI